MKSLRRAQKNWWTVFGNRFIESNCPKEPVRGEEQNFPSLPVIRKPMQPVLDSRTSQCFVRYLARFSQCTVWVNELLRDIGLFELRGSVSHVKKVNSLSHLWINAYCWREPFQTIQFDLVNWFKKIRLHRVIRSRTGCAVNALITDPGEKSMLNKVVVFDIFGPKCIFDASKNSNGPSDVTWTTLKMFLLPFWTWTVYRTYILNGGTESSRTKSKISYTVFRRWTEVSRVWNDMRVSH